MPIISFICFVISLSIILSCLRKNADIFSPFKVYGLTWFISIGLTELKFSRFQHEWSLFSWIVVFTGCISFLVGLFIVSSLSINRSVEAPSSIRKILNESRFHEKYFFIAIIVVSSLYFLSFVVEAIVHGELPILSSVPDDSRKKFGFFGAHLLVTAMPVILFFIVQYFILVKKRIYEHYILAIIFIFIFVTYFTLLVRFNYIVFFLMAACFIYYSSDLFNTRNVLIVGGTVVSLFYGTLQIREARYAENFLYVISDLKFPKEYSFFAGPYMYIVMNLENVARVIDKLNQFTYGYYSFDFLFALTGLKHQLASYYGLEERIYLNSSFNTFPYFYPYYRDFGLLGVFVCPLMLGIIVGIVYGLVKTKPTIFNISIYSFCVFFMAISFFTNPLTMLNNVFMLLLLIIVNNLIVKKEV